MQQAIDNMASKLESIDTKTEFVASNIEAVPRIVHQEIRTTLKLLVNQALERVEIRNEQEMWSLGNFNNTITRDIGSGIQIQKK